MARTARRRYELKSQELNALVEALIAAAQQVYGEFEDSDLVREIVVSALRLMHDDTPRGDLKLVNAAVKELRYAFRVFAPYRNVRKVSIWGSARTGSEHPDWRQAHDLAARMAEQGWMAITGAGGGVMGAAQEGAGRAASFGVNIRLPFEQHANEVIAGDPKLMSFRYFFTRKLMFVKEAHALALFPGGFGTLDEGMEVLTLIQTGKSEILPLVFVDSPGGSYWRDWSAFVERNMRERGLISDADVSLFMVTDRVEEAVHEICNFYSNYHSSRFVQDVLVLRTRHAPNEEQLDQLNVDFSDIVARGRVEVSDPLPAEKDDAPDCARVTLRFDRHGMGRLRQLIDRLNSFVAAEASPPREASPHELVEDTLSPEEESAQQAED